MDLGSRYGSKLDGEKLEPRKYIPLSEGGKLQFGASTRIYTFGSAPPRKAKGGVEASSKGRVEASSKGGLQGRAAEGMARATAAEEEEDPMANYKDEEEESGSAGASKDQRKEARRLEKARRKELKAEMKAEEKQRKKALKKEKRSGKKVRGGLRKLLLSFLARLSTPFPLAGAQRGR